LSCDCPNFWAGRLLMQFNGGMMAKWKPSIRVCDGASRFTYALTRLCGVSSNGGQTLGLTWSWSAGRCGVWSMTQKQRRDYVTALFKNKSPSLPFFFGWQSYYKLRSFTYGIGSVMVAVWWWSLRLRFPDMFDGLLWVRRFNLPQAALATCLDIQALHRSATILVKR